MQSDYEFITSFLAAIHIPQHKTVTDEDVLDDDTENGESLEEKQKRVKPGDTTRANNREELKQRLQAKLEELRGKKVEGGDGKKAEKKLKKTIKLSRQPKK